MSSNRNMAMPPIGGPHEYLPYATTAASRRHTVRTPRNDCHPDRLPQRVKRRLDRKRREWRNVCGRQCFLPAYLYTPTDFLLEAKDGRRPQLRLLICDKGGNPDA